MCQRQPSRQDYTSISSADSPQDANLRKARLQFASGTPGNLPSSGSKCYGEMRQGLTCATVMERWKCEKIDAHNARHTTSSVKHSGGDVMAWVCMAASGVISLEFIDNFIADGSRRMNVEVYRNILSAQIRMNAAELIEQCFISRTIILNIQTKQQRRFCSHLTSRSTEHVINLPWNRLKAK